MTGKIGPETIARIVEHTGEPADALVQGPAFGEDAAAIEYGGGTLVVSTDPISLAAERVGTLGVHVACNDVGASGGDPRWLTSSIFLPPDSDRLDDILDQLDAAARSIDVSIVGGHTEYHDALSRPLLSLTAIGTTERFVPSGGATPGDRVVLTGGAGLEATAILATDFRDRLDVPGPVCDEGERFFEEISVLPAARCLRDHATGMHDPTEGGVLAGCFELASAADVTVDLDRDAVPVREPTRTLCAAADVDPLQTFGSGAVLATLDPGAVDEALASLADAGIEAAEVGSVVDRSDSPLYVDGAPIEVLPTDDMYALWD